ncbi:Aldo/keto reductase [Polyporus arcularius HHB13444]|uniref:Aldo/keto reductase n=1 Tax=Polyporus arcularius HHB13444 TaxID=1314778 RepID=A0A5C3PDP9_9APHY|nr:Aldo/keto reductase [Polyporus arcularius HHB13444]
MDLWPTAPPAKTALGHYRQLSPLSGVYVSPLCLGAMSIGDKWAAYGMGAMDKESSFALLDAYYDAGGNFIDTANCYQDETSEEFIGEWMDQRGIRDQMVIATKKVHYAGNSVKAMTLSLEASLKKLRTHYVDILYVHWWNWDTSIEEIMNGLNNLVAAGKVLYLGISDCPAWIIPKANLYARMTGKTPFSIYQGTWSVMQRDVERDIIPMCRAEGRTVWQDWERNENERKMTKELEKIAEQVGAKNIQAVAIAYVMQKAPYVFPLIGGRKPEQLYANLEALNVTLTEEHIHHIDSVLPFNYGFPYSIIGDGSEPIQLASNAAKIVKWPRAQAIRPH